MIMALASATAFGATRAYFSSGKVLSANTFSTGNVSMNNTWNLPLRFANLIPGVEQSQEGSIQYTGSVAGDIYVGVADFDSSNGRFYDPLKDESYLQIAIFDKDLNSYIVGWTDIKSFFAGWTKIATNVDQNVWKNYKLDVRLKDTVGNELQSKTNISNLVFYAVQKDGAKPSKMPWEFSGNIASF